MAFHPFDVTIPHIAYALLGGFVVLFGMFSLLIREKLYIGEAPLAFVFGIIIGPYCGNIFDPRSWGGSSDETVNTITLEFTRVILAVGVFAIGVELPKAYMARHWKSLFFLLIPVMTWGWLVSAGLIYALIPGLSFLSSLAIAACLTPTDPILAAAVVGGKYADKHVPAHLRHLLAAESGCNDGAAFPFLYIALYLVIEASDKHAIQDWFLITWFYEVLLGVVFGAVIGIAFRHLMKFCERKDLIDRQSYVAQYVSLAMFVIGVTTLLGSDDLLAAFACGTAFAWDGFFNRQTEQSVFSSVIDLLFNIAAFVFIGAWMPFNDFSNEELTLSVWRLIVIAILVLLLRRLPIMLALYKFIPDVKTFREAIFSGHFGPIGVGAVFISTLAAEKLPTPEDPTENQVELLAATIQPIVAFMVLCSITIHGLSIPFFSLGRRVHSVSRTWSRHQSMDPGSLPDWAMNTRRVQRPEDIVINRDSALERGELRSNLDYEKTIHQGPHMDYDQDKLDDTPTPSSSSPSKENGGAHFGDPNAVTEGRPDEPPDGTAVEEEWKEGPDIVIERQTGPGEEVEVQVKRGAAAGEDGEAGEVLQTFHGSPSEIEQAVAAFTENLKEKAARELHVLEKELGNGVAKATKAFGSKSGDSDSSSRPSVSPDDEDDDGWASDRSNHPDGPQSYSPQDDDSRIRAKSSKQKARMGHGHNSRRTRMSIRRNLLSKSKSTVPPLLVTEPQKEEEEERGRVSTIKRPTHHRIDSLQVPGTPRSASPARSVRSVRFAADSSLGDESSSTPVSPRHIAFDLPRDSRS